jgi:hypothetical protein
MIIFEIIIDRGEIKIGIGNRFGRELVKLLGKLDIKK